MRVVVRGASWLDEATVCSAHGKVCGIARATKEEDVEIRQASSKARYV